MGRLPTARSCGVLLDSVAVIGRLQRRTLRDATAHRAARAGVLSAVDELGPIRATALATHLRLDNSVVSRQLASLDQDGLVERVTDPADGRAQLVQLSAAGQVLLGELRQRASDQLRHQLAGWSEGDLESLVSSLRRLEHSMTVGEDTASSPEFRKGLTP